jgi:hypothetical protein
MRARIGALAFAALLSVSIAGCEKTGEKEQKAEGVANKQAEEAQYEAYTKAAAAQAEADRQIAAARAAFEQTREEYRHARQGDLDSVNLTITDLEIKDRRVTGKAKATLDTSLPAIRTQRDAFASDLKSVPLATPATWDETKARLDKEWEALKTSVSEAP